MDWWTGMGGQRATFVGGPSEHVAVHPHQLDVASAIFDPWLNTDDLDLGVILNQASCGPVSASPMATSGIVNPSNVSNEPNKTPTLTCQQTFACQQQQLVSSASLVHQNNHHQHQNHHQVRQQQTGRQTDTHSRPPSDNKRQAVNNINNSKNTSHSQQQQQQQQHEQQQHQQPAMGPVRRPGGSSVAGSPLSSSLGSSPLNNHANYLSSPHSTSSPPQVMNQNYGETQVNTDQKSNSNSNSHNNNRGTNLVVGDANPFTSVQQHLQHHNNHQQQSAAYFPEGYIIEGPEHEISHTIEDATSQHGQLHAGGAYMLQTGMGTRPQLVYQDNIIVMTCPQQQQLQQQQQQQQQQPSRVANRNIIAQTGNRSNCGSSLLSGLPSSSMGQRQGTSKLTANRKFNTKAQHSGNSSNNMVNKHQVRSNEDQLLHQQPPQKTRRCRHITDYVLADEEKRLLIKEGHADFPMTCQARPLTKSEERILRKIRRKIRNKKSAQCSRQRKKEYVEELERKYAAILRENDELRQLLTGDVKVERTLEFVDQLDDDSVHREHSNEQQQATLFENHQQSSIANQCRNENFLDNSLN